MITVERCGDDRISIDSDFPQRDKELIKSLPGSSYSVKTHAWTAPLTWATCRALRGTFGENLVIGEKLVDWARRERAERVDPAMELRAAWDIEDNTSRGAEILKSWR